MLPNSRFVRTMMIAQKQCDGRQGENHCNGPGNCPSPRLHDALRWRGDCVAITSGGERRLPPLPPTVAIPGFPFRHGKTTSAIRLSAASFRPTTALRQPPGCGDTSRNSIARWARRPGSILPLPRGLVLPRRSTLTFNVARRTARSAIPRCWRVDAFGLASGHNIHPDLSLRRGSWVAPCETSVGVDRSLAGPCLKAKVPSPRCRSVQTGRTAQ